jgi:hypothetical protein
MISLIPALTEGAIFLALIGILVQGRARYCRCFAGYLAAVLTGDLLIMAWPEVFYTRKAWVVSQSIYSILKMGVAAELTATVFAAFPGAKARARRTLFLTLIVTASMMIGIPHALTFQAVVMEWMPRLLSGTIWLMTGIAILVVYYRIPLDPFHRMIVTGFVPYHVICVSLYDLIHRYGWSFLPYFNKIQPAAYLLLVAYWAKESWRREELPEVSRNLVYALHPWRVRAGA